METECPIVRPKGDPKWLRKWWHFTCEFYVFYAVDFHAWQEKGSPVVVRGGSTHTVIHGTTEVSAGKKSNLPCGQGTHHRHGNHTGVTAARYCMFVDMADTVIHGTTEVTAGKKSNPPCGQGCPRLQERRLERTPI